MDLSRRSYHKELLDRNDIPFADIRRNMQELNFINTYLGGHQITVSGLKKIIRHGKPAGLPEILICEIGCGGGDNLKAIAGWCKKNNIHASFIGIDINGDCIEVANDMCRDLKARFIHSDYKKVNFEKKPGIIFSSLFCHHFSNEELVDMLQWMRTNATAGFFINDLHRHIVAYHSIKWLSRIFSKSYLVKNDAPLSVARGFAKQEWMALLHAAEIRQFSIYWKWAFRWLIVAIHEPEPVSLDFQSQHSSH
ncbi:MAG: methyltransferase domain-containing protein [Chitinophagaceae bacterium]|nr:methyltransferase domain-containing protein [Chitinophagaceae bacterium]